MNRLQRSGFAIVAVLVLVVLLTILIVSFLVIMRLDRSSTQNFSSAAKAQELALSGLQEITGDLLMEIDAGSLEDGTPAMADYTQHDLRVYVPAVPEAILPARIGFKDEDYVTHFGPGGIPRTLLRVSRAEASFFISPPDGYDRSKLPPNRASRASSTDKSANGRLLNASRWNKPMLLGTDVPAAFATAPPDWVYVTRSGSRAVTDGEIDALRWSREIARPHVVLGRYAFAIYDEGALLDINAAGFPSNVRGTPEGAIAIGGKSAVSYADLSQLPGLSALQDELDGFVQWRNKGSIAHYGGFPQMVPELMRKGLKELKPQDSLLLGRQDLIEYVTKELGTTAPLPFLGTFSSAENAPSWSPATPAGSSIDYAALAEIPASPNRHLGNIRFQKAQSVTHYTDDGTRSDYTVEAGFPLLRRRFSLARLAWLQPNGPKAGISAAAIMDCFGLKWVSGSDGMAGYWEYAAAGENPQLHIKTLAEVAEEGRAPNFFELLKAGILSGSLGKDPGARSDKFGQHPDGGGPATEGPAGYQFGTEAGNPGYSEDKDRHLLQIGANIIDQADTDSYPTGIYFPAFTEDAPAGKVYNTLYGNENLPYLTRLFLIRAAYPGPGNLNAWLQPEIWNPQQAPAVGTPAPPTKFRVRSYGRAQTDYYLTWGPISGPPKFKTTGVAKNYDSTPDREAGIIYFNNQAGTDSFFYTKPRLLPKSQVDTDRTAATNFYDGQGLNPNYPLNRKTGQLPEKDLYEFAGVWTGSVDLSTSPWVPDPAKPADKDKGQNPWMAPAPNNNWHILLNCTPMGLTVSLECWDEAASAWRPYSFISRLDVALRSDNWDGNKNPPLPAAPDLMGLTTFAVQDRGTDTFARPDPRTDRFSVGVVNSSHGPWVFNDRFASGTMENGRRIFGFGSRFPRTTHGFIYSGGTASQEVRRLVSAWAVNQTSPPFPAPYDHNAYYHDPDGVLRPGDSLHRDYTTGDGSMLFHADASGKTASAEARRPVILNRPFLSVGELGYVFRDLPFKSLDFFTAESADSALLDIFSVVDEGGGRVSGKLHPNSAPKEVLQAVLAGARQKAELRSASTPVSLSGEDALAVAEEMAKTLAATPITDTAGLVNTLAPAVQAGFAKSPVPPEAKTANKANKAYAEAPVRALAAVTNIRTWNLLIDVIAQSGRLHAQADDLDDFVVEGEKRYWLHIAIDRVSGKVIDRQLEPVYE